MSQRRSHQLRFQRRQRGNVLNQVAHSYDANFFGALVKTRQAHAGAAGDSAPAVQYVYEAAPGAGGGAAKNIRLQKVVYPNGREVYYNCPASGIGAAMNRVDNIASSASPQDSQKFAAYSYLGAASIVKLDYPAVTGGLGLSYDPNANGLYESFDRFGRVIDHGWRRTDGNAVDRFTYGYDRAGNRTFRKNMVGSALGRHLDEKYAYDGLDRLTDANRGDYDVASGQITNRSFAQVFDLSGLGNWRGFLQDTSGDGTWPLTQTRTHNLVNELTGITGGGWPAPTYDAAGNMTSGPMGTDPNLRMHMKWDAWNRQVAVYADSQQTPGTPGSTIALYSYDGRNFRIAKAVASGANWDRTDFYYNDRQALRSLGGAGWQMLEERKTVGQQSAATVATTVYVQYVWDLRYIDSPVLRDEDTDADGDCTDSGGSERLYYLNDVNFNVTALVDPSTGNPVERYVYSPYGVPTICNSDWSATVAWADSKKNEILYCGYRHDPETADDASGMREYDPMLGQWLSQDPSGYAYGLNMYQYCLDSPAEFTDFSGMGPNPVITVAGLTMFKVHGSKTQVMTDAPKAQWNRTSTVNYSFWVSFDETMCTVTVRMRLKVLAGADETLKAAWKKAIEDKWSDKFKVCCKCKCKGGMPILVDMVYKNDLEDTTITPRAPGSGANGGTEARGGTASATDWGIKDTVDVTHEFGHLLGNLDEYFTVNNVKYGDPNPNGGVMNYSLNGPNPNNYQVITDAINENMKGKDCTVKKKDEKCPGEGDVSSQPSASPSATPVPPSVPTVPAPKPNASRTPSRPRQEPQVPKEKWD